METFNYQRAKGGRCLSGKSVRGKPRISKRENDLIRALLYQGTLSAVRYNPQVRGIYQRLKEKGAPEKKARIAAAHKLLLIAHAIYTKGVPYDPSYSRGG
ncbi:MAG: transposase [Caldiserica bacterium]|nr:transposase [Caldisericota bacterium]